MSEVDKFKRRVIRAVARLLRKDQTPSEEMWKALKNEAGCDCKLLWQRMRALTLKKMKRLILAEDRLENIAAVAKMTLTDWLLFDLVLVHEDIDVIGQDLKTEPSMLTDLFNVVKRFQIEGKQGEALATAWTAATFYYNSFGRQCSPMLLQRRWYQLKKVTRHNFYKFWFEYRGNARLIGNAKEFQPTKLQADIALRFPHLVTTPFLEWDKMIKERWIILPEEFEAKIKKKTSKAKPAINEPDVVLLEPQIETIDLGKESDNECEPADENSKDSHSDNTALNPVSLAAAIKKEPGDEYEMDFEDEFGAKALESTEIPFEDNGVDDCNENAIPNQTFYNDVEMSDDINEINTMPKICSVAGNFDEDSVTAASTVESGLNSTEVTTEIDYPLESVAEVTNESTEANINVTSATVDPNTNIDTQTNDGKPTQVEESEQAIDTNEVVGNSSNEVMTEIDTILKSAAEAQKEARKYIIPPRVRIGPKSRILKYTDTEVEPIHIESDQPIDIHQSHDSNSDLTSCNQVMAEVNDILKSAATITQKTGGVSIKSRSKLAGPKSRMHNRPNVNEKSIDIDESDNDSIISGSGPNEIMTEIDNILESAIHKKSEIHKPINKTSVSDCTLTNTNEVETIEEITDTTMVNDSLDEVNSSDIRVTNREEITTKDDFKAISDIKVEETPLEDIIKNMKSVNETSCAENVIDDPSIVIPTDITFEDDGIEFVDDGIAFEENDDYSDGKKDIKTESESAALDGLENIEESSKFDLKLLMHPCVFTRKLDDMSIFKNKNMYEIRDKLSLETALLESKINVEEKKVEIKLEQDNKSVKSRDSSDSDSSDAEDGIPEKNKVKLSSYMLQKPKSRSYNPIQLCKNPDFNTRLKRLTVGFLSSGRNRLLLKCLKPMTIDLSKAFEAKLINGTVYLKADDRPKIKCEKPDEVIEEPSVTAVLPSAMLVQSLIDNSNPNLQDLLPSPAVKPYDHLLNERQKPINLPDINNIRRINQHLLTAEVTPMRIQSNVVPSPPVKLLTTPNTIFMNALERCDRTIGPTEVSTGGNSGRQVAGSEMISKSKDAGNTVAIPGKSSVPGEKKRKEPVRPTYNVSWNSTAKRHVKHTVEDEFLLTLDTLSKMLHMFKENNSEDKAAPDKSQKKTLIKQKLELQRRMDQFEKKIENVPSEPEDGADDKGTKPKEKKKETKKEETKKEEPLAETVTPKINIVKDKPYGPYCCWARNKLAAEGKKAIRAHQCPRICRCCCRDELAQKLCPSNRSKLVKPVKKNELMKSQTSTIVISDDEETKKVCESIETVVSESRKVKVVTSIKPTDKEGDKTMKQNKGKPRTEVSIQCDISDFGKMNLASVVSARSDARPEKSQKSEVFASNDANDVSRVTNSKKYKPVKLRKDLLMEPYRSSLPPLKHQGHITIDASQKSVQIHSDPVYFNTDGHEKILYLNNKQEKKDLTSPIFLGENKILLTDIKFPNNPAELMLKSKPLAPALPSVSSLPIGPPTAPSVAPLQMTVPLPSGVQIMLLPDGQLTYGLEPNAKLTDEELATVPTILDAIRTQLNQTSPTNHEVINLTKESDIAIPTPSIDTNSAEKFDASANSAIVDIVSNQANVGIEVGGKTVIETDKQASVASSDSENATEPSKNSNESLLEKDKQQSSVASSDIDNATEPMETSNITMSQIDKQKPSVATNDIENSTEPTEHSKENKLCDVQVETRIDTDSINTEKDLKDDSEKISLRTEVLESKVSEVIQTEKENESVLKAIDNTLLLQDTALVDESNNHKDKGRNAIPKGTAELIDLPGNILENLNESTNSTANSNRKTLLSDLMEMSGINEDDIQTNALAVNENTTVQPGLVPPSPGLPNSTEVADVPEILPSSVTRVTASPGMPSIPELTPITSFSQLKYACEHNGKFFKLDLQLGSLSKIAVCIKKNKPRIPPPLHMLQKSVIDLTEDHDHDTTPDKTMTPAKKKQTREKREVPLNEAILPAHVIQTNKNLVSLDEEILPVSVIQTQKSLLKHNNKPDIVKPLKLFRAIRILKKPSEDARIPLKITPKLGRGLPESASVHVKHKRKQELQQPQIRDESSMESKLPIEEISESSLDSSELDQYIWKDNQLLSSSSEDDSSDDEPLAFKAKRIRVDPQLESSEGEVDKELAVVEPEKERNPQVEFDIEMVSIERLSRGKEVAEKRLTVAEDLTKGADGKISIAEQTDIEKQVHAMEEVDVPEDADITEETEITGVEEVPIAGDVNLLPALQVIERMDEDDDDDADCILGF